VSQRNKLFFVSVFQTFVIKKRNRRNIKKVNVSLDVVSVLFVVQRECDCTLYV